MEKYIQQSTSLFGSLKNAVLGNPVTREFTIGQQIATFGPGLLWKVFDGKKKTTGQVRMITFKNHLFNIILVLDNCLLRNCKSNYKGLLLQAFFIKYSFYNTKRMSLNFSNIV